MFPDAISIVEHHVSQVLPLSSPPAPFYFLKKAAFYHCLVVNVNSTHIFVVVFYKFRSLIRSQISRTIRSVSIIVVVWSCIAEHDRFFLENSDRFLEFLYLVLLVCVEVGVEEAFGHRDFVDKYFSMEI